MVSAPGGLIPGYLVLSRVLRLTFTDRQNDIDFSGTFR